MGSITIEILKYVICILMLVYTYFAFFVFQNNEEKQKWVFRKQNMIMFAIQGLSYFCLLIGTFNTESFDFIKFVSFYLMQIVLFVVTIIVYKMFYKRLSRLVLNNMLMLLMISFVMLHRLEYDKAIRQFGIVVISLAGCLIVPFIIRKLKFIKEIGWVYGGLGAFLLLLVLLIGKEEYGAKNWIIIGSFRLQPSEFVKLLYVFFIASVLSKAKDKQTLLRVSILAAAHIMILVLEKDLGGALIFSVTYLIMIYVATSKPLYLLGGAGIGMVASVIGYFIFSHVRVRVTAWRDPWSVIDGQGYQIAQSLFAIGTGGWFGMGLTKGLPTSIPVVSSDFIFSAISEEYGGVFAMCIIFIYLSCFLMFVNIAMKMKTEFYKLTALGLSTVYIFQVFLTLGGVTKFIPSTGVTLPLISYGGSSILCTILIFSIIQGLYVLNQDEVDAIEREKKKRERERNESRDARYERAYKPRQF